MPREVALCGAGNISPLSPVARCFRLGATQCTPVLCQTGDGRLACSLDYIPSVWPGGSPPFMWWTLVRTSRTTSKGRCRRHLRTCRSFFVARVSELREPAPHLCPSFSAVLRACNVHAAGVPWFCATCKPVACSCHWLRSGEIRLTWTVSSTNFFFVLQTRDVCVQCLASAQCCPLRFDLLPSLPGAGQKQPPGMLAQPNGSQGPMGYAGQEDNYEKPGSRKMRVKTGSAPSLC